MTTKKKNLSENQANVSFEGQAKKVAIITSQWNPEVTYAMESAAIKTLENNGVSSEDINVTRVPGTFELALGAKISNNKFNPHAIICIGCVIKGETDHDKYISGAVANAIQTLNIVLEKPVIFGVLTPNTMEQATDRAGGKYGNKGDEAAMAALQMMMLNDQSKKKSIGY